MLLAFLFSKLSPWFLGVNVWLLEAEEAVVIVGGIMGIFAFLEL